MGLSAIVVVDVGGRRRSVARSGGGALNGWLSSGPRVSGNQGNVEGCYTLVYSGLGGCCQWKAISYAYDKPEASHKGVKDCYAELEQFARLGVKHESAVRPAFQTLGTGVGD